MKESISPSATLGERGPWRAVLSQDREKVKRDEGSESEIGTPGDKKALQGHANTIAADTPSRTRVGLQPR